MIKIEGKNRGGEGEDPVTANHPDSKIVQLAKSMHYVSHIQQGHDELNKDYYQVGQHFWLLIFLWLH